MVSMCNKRIECVSGVDKIVDNQQHTNQTPDSMDTPTSVTNSTPSSVDDSQRVKLLCSFLGSIMPRPQDGKLRYVGGETRIVSLPMDIGYEELMNKMRELYDAVAVVKYQQPDEDLDALVSVVNDDDVTNMMEEYEKLGSGDGFTRLRIFLFPHPDQDGSLHYIDGNGRDNERRYVDALNNVNDGNDFRRNPDSPLIGQIDDILVNDQFLNPTSLEGSFHGQRGGEMPIPQYNLHHVAVPQRYNELDGGPWSPAYYSPGFHGHHDPRQLSEFAETPSSARHRMPFGELPDRDFERMPEEYARPHPNHALYDHQPGYSENLVWMPTGDLSSDRAGFPPNILHGPSCFEGNRVAFQRNQLQMEQHMGGGPPPQVSNIGAEGSSNRDTFITNTDAKAHHIIYQKDQNDPLPVYNGTQNQERRGMQHQLSPHADEVRAHIPGCGRFNENYVGDGPGMNYSFGHGSMVDGHHMSSSYVHHRPGPELSNEVFHEPANGLHQLRIANPDESSVRYANFPYACGAENIQSMPHGHMHVQNSWRNTQNPVQGVPYEIQSSNSRVNYSINSTPLRGMIESNHRYGNGMDFQRQWVESSQGMLGLDAKPSPIYSQNHLMSSNHNACAPEIRQSFSPEPVRLPVSQEMLNISPNIATSGYIQGMPNATTADIATEKDVSSVANNENLNARKSPSSEQKKDADGIGQLSESIDSNVLMLPEQNGNAVNVTRLDTSAVFGDSKLMPENLSFLPKLMASVKKAALEEAEVVKAKVEENSDPMYHNSRSKGSAVKESEATNAHEESEPELDSDNIDINKIEPTKAEEEAIERGLQTIKNEDLEEIRELGSGTYGAVYHGKWKGSDVAIKRIKASCFAGKPSERERLIADFWKEALILSSLHHPNVVSFYGIVRDGPDGSLATVTEFMINGSLKQFLQKKDRTIDRRKRLIIAMDAAFGMEYLHGKNIVHFDLKCENLLVNMRDPQRPICKIGDLGLSKVKQHTLVSGGVRGTLPWMAPELLSGKGQMVTEKIDVYSFGIVMWELLTGEEPYADMHCASIIGGIVNNTLRPKIPTWCDPEWKSLMESCWACDPADRPSFSEISRKLRSMAAAMNVK